MCERRGELRSRKEFDYTVSTYPNEPHHVNIVQPSRHTAPKNIQAAVYHLSAYWEKKQKNNLPYWTVSSPQDKQPWHILQELQLSPV